MGVLPPLQVPSATRLYFLEISIVWKDGNRPWQAAVMSQISTGVMQVHGCESLIHVLVARRQFAKICGTAEMFMK